MTYFQEVINILKTEFWVEPKNVQNYYHEKKYSIET